MKRSLPINSRVSIKDNKNIRSIFFDHWKSVEKINPQAIANFPTFCLIHSKEINHLKGSTLNKRVLNSISKVDYIIANSNFTKNLGISIGIPEKNIYIIHPGCDDPEKIESKFPSITKTPGIPNSGF